MITQPEATAKTKHCFHVGGKCLGSGCMFWRRKDGPMRECIVDWPADIAVPAAADVEDPRARMVALIDRCKVALRPLVGGTYADTGETIVRILPVASDLKQVRITLEKEPYGQCTVGLRE
jgi:hypothetical protein